MGTLRVIMPLVRSPQHEIEDRLEMRFEVHGDETIAIVFVLHSSEPKCGDILTTHVVYLYSSGLETPLRTHP